MCPAAADLGTPIAALVQRCGLPERVASDDSGNHFVFAADGDTAFADAIVDADGGNVQALRVWGSAPESLTGNVGGTPHAFTLGTSLAQNDAALVNAAQYSFGATRVYGSPQRTVVASFDPHTNALASVAIGARATLERLAILPGPLNPADALRYRAPRLRHGAELPRAGSTATIVRVDVDREGVVRHVAVIVPSADATFDAALPAKLDDDRYAPATLMDRAIAGSVYREIAH